MNDVVARDILAQDLGPGYVEKGIDVNSFLKELKAGSRKNSRMSLHGGYWEN